MKIRLIEVENDLLSKMYGMKKYCIQRRNIFFRWITVEYYYNYNYTLIIDCFAEYIRYNYKKKKKKKKFKIIKQTKL